MLGTYPIRYLLRCWDRLPPLAQHETIPRAQSYHFCLQKTGPRETCVLKKAALINGLDLYFIYMDLSQTGGNLYQTLRQYNCNFCSTNRQLVHHTGAVKRAVSAWKNSQLVASRVENSWTTTSR